MELPEPTRTITQILEEERKRPTVSYVAAAPSQVTALQDLFYSDKNHTLFKERMESPRPVHENPREFQFRSTNHDLLSAVMAQVPASARNSIYTFFSERILDRHAFQEQQKRPEFPSWDNLTSELPLIVEFCLRHGFKESLLRTLSEGPPELTPGLLLLLIQMEETIALNFDVFTKNELEQIPEFLMGLHEKAARYVREATAADELRTASTILNGVRIQTCHLAIAFRKVCQGIDEACKQARYWRLKGSLLSGLNLEVNQDKTAVGDFLQKLGFSRVLLDS
jgi:hypothetical protein